jgi:predicted nucleic acid-binding protein
MNREIVIADSSCLIVLENIQELSLLKKLFGEILITQDVKTEFGLELPKWIKIRTIKDQSRVDALALVLDKGEASAIALSMETAESVLIIDEKKGRRIAQELNIKIIGTLGIILKAKENGLISSIEDILEKLENADFRISPSLKKKILSIT